MKPKFSTFLICVGIFFFFVLIKFPFQNLKGRIFKSIYEKTGILLMAESIYPTLFGWPGIGMKNVDVSFPFGGSGLDLSSKKVTVRFGLSGVWPPTPSVSLSMNKIKKGGDLYLKFGKIRSRFKFLMESDSFDLSQLSLPPLTEPLVGVLDTDCHAVIYTDSVTQSYGELKAEIKQFKVPTQNLQGFILPQLNLHQLKANLEIKNGVVEITSFQFGKKESDLQGSVTGEIRLNKDWMKSQLDIILKFYISEEYKKNSQAAILASILDGYRIQGGEYSMRWVATFENFANNDLQFILPQKLTM